MIKNYPPGSDITLFNTAYFYPKKQENGKWDKGSIDLIYRDNLTGEKHVQHVENPNYEFYVAKDDVNIDHNMLFIEKDKVHKVSTPYVDLEKTIAELTGNEEFYYENIRLGQRAQNKKLHTHPRIFNSDNNIEEHYRFRFNNLYKNETYNIEKTYFDIEADTINMKGDFPEPGECPINAVSIINESNNMVYVLILRNPENPLIEEFERGVGPALFNELKLFIREQVGGWKQEIRFGIDKLEYEFLFFDEEIELVYTIFKIFNTFKPDFILAWNMGFDIPYIIARIQELGYRPEDIMCHPDFKIKIAQYMKDDIDRKTGKFKDMTERGDFAKISSYSVFLDQMIQFASRRKGQSAFQSFKLDYIGEIITGVNKLDYHHITSSLAKLPYVDFKTFIFYNIIDTIVQKCIEVKTGDIDYIFNKCLINNTRYSKGHRQTVYLVNRGTKEFYEEGFIIGNNNNRTNQKPETKFPGAFIADPRKTNDYSKMLIGGVPVNLYDNLDDYDYSSLYPSIMREFNIAPHTQIGKIIIETQIYLRENPSNNEYFTRGGAFIEDIQSHNYLSFGYRWLGLANYSQLYKDVINFYTSIAYSKRPVIMFNEDGSRDLFIENKFGRNLFIEKKEGLRPLFLSHIKRPESIYEIPDKINVSEVVYSE